MKYTREDFTKLAAEVVNDFITPTDDGESLPRWTIMLLSAMAAKIINKLFNGEKEIEIITEEQNHDDSNK